MQPYSTQMTRDIAYQYNYQADQGKVITLLTNDLSAFTAQYGQLDPSSWVNGYLDELQCKATIASLAEIPLPNFLNTDSDSDRLIKTLNMEWKSPRFELALYVSTTPFNVGSVVWVEVGRVSLTHGSGYPFKTYRVSDLLTDNLARKFGMGARLGFSILQAYDANGVSYGVPSSIDDITITGVYTQELNWIQPNAVNVVQVQGGSVQQVTSYTNSYQSTVRTTSTTLLAQNNARVSGQVVNNGATNSITITYSGLTSGNTVSLAPGATASFPAGYKGAVNGVCSATAGTLVTASETYNA